MKKIFLLTFIFCAIFTTINAQQIAERSFFTNNSYQWNPAMTGIYDFTEITLNYRQQWVGFNDAPLTATIGAQVPLYKRNMAFGAFLVTDRVGALRSNSVNLNYAYKLNFRGSDAQLSLGFMGTLTEFHIDAAGIEVNDIDDVLLPDNGASKIIPNAGVGVFYTTNGSDDFEDTYYYGGIAVNQLYTGDVTFSTNPANYERAIHGNALLGARFVAVESYFEPSVWVNYAERNVTNVNLGLKFEQYNTFWLGASVATSLRFTLQGGVILDQDFLGGGVLRVGAQGNYNIGGLGTHQGLGYEFFTAYRFEN